MSAALNTHPDTSLNHSVRSIPADISLGSLGSGISTPARSNNLRIPSTSTAPSSVLPPTPSPPTVRRYGTSGNRGGEEEDADDGQGDLLNTPGEKQWGNGNGFGFDTPMTTRQKRTRSSASGATKGANLTLRDQEKVSTIVFTI